MKDGKIIVKDIDVNGTENLVNLLKNDTKVITIFLRVPKEELRKRLENRIDKPSPKEIQLRLNRFDYEESKIGSYDYVLKNNDLEKTLQIITAIIKSEENLIFTFLLPLIFYFCFCSLNWCSLLKYLSAKSSIETGVNTSLNFLLLNNIYSEIL